MILDAPGISGLDSDAFDGFVVEIELDDFRVGFSERFGIDGVSVVLAGDGDRPVFQVFDRVIASAVTEFEFVG